MFDHIGSKVKSLAKAVCWFGIVGSFLMAIATWIRGTYYNPTGLQGFVTLIVGSLVSWLGSLTLYAFGQLVEDVSALRTANDVATMRPHYQKAMTLKRQKKYAEASAIFSEISAFEDAAEQEKECFFCMAMELKNTGKLKEAAEAFDSLIGYKDADVMMHACWYQLGTELCQAKKYDEAYEAFDRVGNYKHAKDMLPEVRYRQAKDLAASGKKEEAMEIFYCMPGYKDVKKLVDADDEMRQLQQQWREEDEMLEDE